MDGLSTLSGGGFYQLPAGTSTLSGTSGVDLGTSSFAPTGTLAGAGVAPTSYSNQYGTYNSAAAAAQAAADAANTGAYYNDQINNLQGQNGRLDSQLNTGLDNLSNSYNNSLNRMNDQKAKAQGNYNDQTQTNTTQYARNRSAIQGQTASRTSALQRLLGINGAGNSSAAYEAVPYAAGLQGTQQLSDAQTGYATNSRNLDKSWQDTLDTYNNGLQDLGNDKTGKENALRSSINQTRASLLSQIQGLGQQRDMAGGADYITARNNEAGYQGQINSLLDSIAGLGNQYSQPIALKTANVGYNAPDLQTYNLRTQGNTAMSSSNPGTSDVSQVFAPLLGQQRDEFGNLIQA